MALSSWDPQDLAEQIDQARWRLDGSIKCTPLLENSHLNERVGGRLLIKAESLQRSGSFKIRGAANKVLQLSADERRRGVVCWSSGNHALAVSTICAQEQIPAVIVMPDDAPQAKIAGVQGHGAEIRFYNRREENREEIGRSVAAERSAVIVPPFDDPAIIAGQGTAGLELIEQATAMGARPELVLTAASGGGLIAGVGTAVRATVSEAQIVAVEPESYDDHAQSLAAGERRSVEAEADSICDALLSPMPGELTFDVNARQLAGAVSVSDDEALTAMKTAFEVLKLVVEPGGATPLAALLAGKISLAGRTGAVVLSGGNVDAEVFTRALTTVEA